MIKSNGLSKWIFKTEIIFREVLILSEKKSLIIPQNIIDVF